MKIEHMCFIDFLNSDLTGDVKCGYTGHLSKNSKIQTTRMRGKAQLKAARLLLSSATKYQLHLKSNIKYI